MEIKNIASELCQNTMTPSEIALICWNNRRYTSFGGQAIWPADVFKAKWYNGHEKNVLNRVRSHFAVANSKTGALGIKHYHLSNRDWVVSVFHKGILETIKCLTINQKNEIARFCDSKTGRVAVETAWRIEHGWTLLCKA